MPTDKLKNIFIQHFDLLCFVSSVLDAVITFDVEFWGFIRLSWLKAAVSEILFRRLVQKKVDG